MKIVKNSSIISMVVATLLLSGCGSDGTTTLTEAADQSRVITVERGPLLDANVTDEQGHVAVELGEGRYAFDHEPHYPITATGGYIDVDRNGKIDAGEVKNELQLSTHSGDVITMATTLAGSSENLEILQSSFELTKEQIETQVPSHSQAIEAFSNTLYSYSIQNGYTNPSQIPSDVLQGLANTYKEERESYRGDGQSVHEHEQAVMNTLPVVTLDNADAQQVQEQLQEKIDESSHHFEDIFSNHEQTQPEPAQATHEDQQFSWQSQSGYHSQSSSEEAGSDTQPLPGQTQETHQESHQESYHEQSRPEPTQVTHEDHQFSWQSQSGYHSQSSSEEAGSDTQPLPVQTQQTHQESHQESYQEQHQEPEQHQYDEQHTSSQSEVSHTQESYSQQTHENQESHESHEEASQPGQTSEEFTQMHSGFTNRF
jgi:hypothetical protein